MATISDNTRHESSDLPHSASHHDLDALIGVWSQEEAAEFEAAVAPFQTIDSDWQARASARKAAPRGNLG